MAEAGQRQEALSFNKNVFRIVALLFLVHVGQSLDLDDDSLQFMNAIQRVREGARLLRERGSGTEHVLTLLDITNYVANKKQLKLFQLFLQEAVDEAYQQKVKKNEVANVSERLVSMIMLEYLPKIQKWKSGDPVTKRLAEVTERFVRVLGHCFSLRKELYAGEANKTETKLENILNDLNSQLRIHDPV